MTNTMLTKKRKKVSAEWAYSQIPHAKNRGELAELYTIINFYCTEYNPTLKGSLGGDVYGPTCGHMQVKMYDGAMTIPDGYTGDKKADLRKVFNDDASPRWIVWADKDHREYAVFDKEELFRLLTGNLMEDLLKYDERNGEKKLRLKMGEYKKKYFMNKLEKNKARGF